MPVSNFVALHNRQFFAITETFTLKKEKTAYALYC